MAGGFGIGDCFDCIMRFGWSLGIGKKAKIYSLCPILFYRRNLFFDRPALSDIILAERMKKTSVFLLVSGFWSLASAPAAQAVDFPLSKYGQIQNVQSYSSNPFYNPDSPYNQRLPTPIYARGTELNAGECREVADSLVAQQCAQRNNCLGLSYSDVRPAVVIEMSNLTGHNYLTACVGYIQPAFEDYMKSANVVSINGFPSAFPMAGQTTENSGSSLVLNNPFERKDPKWSDDRDERKKEMSDLQRQNGSEDIKLSAETFPTTYADLSFAQRMENDKAGYEPWKDASGYKPIKIETDETRYTRDIGVATQQATLATKQKELLEITDPCGWCKQYSTECFTKFNGKLADLNKGKKENACAAKSYGTDTEYKEWAVISDTACGWVLKEDANTITLDDSACGKSDPNQNTTIPSGSTTEPSEDVIEINLG